MFIEELCVARPVACGLSAVTLADAEGLVACVGLVACAGLKPVEGLADCVVLVPVAFWPVLTAAGLVAEADGLDDAVGLEPEAVADGRAEAPDAPGLTLA